MQILQRMNRPISALPQRQLIGFLLKISLSFLITTATVSSKTFYKTFSLLESDSQTRVLIHKPVFSCQWLDVPWCNIASMELSFGTKNDFQQRFDITWRLCVQ